MKNIERPLKILLLEDSSFDAEIIKRTLLKEKMNCEFHLTMDKKGLLQSLEEFSPDVVLSDNSMPQFNATEALRIVREQLPLTPFILITGTISEEFAVNIIKEGADDYILKDRMTRLPSAINMALRQRESEKDNISVLQKLMRSEEKYRTLVERVSDGFIALDKEWNFIYVNKIAASLFGKPAHYLTGRNIWKEYPSSIDKPFYKAYHEAMQNQKNIYLEDYSEAVNLWIYASIYPSPSGLSIYFRDITEQRKAEMEAKKTEEKYRSFIERITDAFISLDKNWNYTYLNAQAGELIHRNPAEMIGKNVWEEFPDIVGSATYEAFTKAMKEQRYITNIDYYPPFDLWQENHIYPSKDGLSVFIRDITEKKKSEEALISNELRFRTLTSNAPVGIFQTDAAGKTIYVNDTWLRITELTLNEAMGDGWQTVVHPDDKDDQQNQWQEKSAKGLESSSEFRLINRKGNIKWVIGKATPIFNNNRLLTGYIGTLADITESKKLEAELLGQQKKEQLKITATALEAQEKERNEIGRELHDNVNQILVGTKLILSMVKNKPKEAAALVESSINNLQNAIIENRKIAHELVAPDFESTSLVDQISNLTDSMLKAASVNVRIDIDMQEKLLNDRQKLAIYRIAQEQCTNIIKYAKATEVDIFLNIKDNVFKMVISDNGHGMETDKKTKGIGLRNIKGRLSIFNGNATINSKPGKGFTLIIEIPLASS